MSNSLSLVTKNESLPMISGFVPKIMLGTESGPVDLSCQIEADNDLQAAEAWIQLYAKQPKTLNAYRREVERFLLWCTYERGLCLKQLRVKDLEAYFSFLKKVPLNWCTTRVQLRKGRDDALWRPFLGPLNPSAFLLAIRVLNSFLNYLVQAQYLQVNPIKLTREHKGSVVDPEITRYRVWE